MNLETRIRKLERWNRVLVAMLVVGVIVGIATGAAKVAGTGQFELVTAQRFGLLDKDGKLRGEWKIDSENGASNFSFSSPDDRRMIVLTVDNDNGAIMIRKSRDDKKLSPVISKAYFPTNEIYISMKIEGRDFSRLIIADRTPGKRFVFPHPPSIEGMETQGIKIHLKKIQ